MKTRPENKNAMNPRKDMHRFFSTRKYEIQPNDYLHLGIGTEVINSDTLCISLCGPKHIVMAHIKELRKKLPDDKKIIGHPHRHATRKLYQYDMLIPLIDEDTITKIFLYRGTVLKMPHRDQLNPFRNQQLRNAALKAEHQLLADGLIEPIKIPEPEIPPEDEEELRYWLLNRQNII